MVHGVLHAILKDEVAPIAIARLNVSLDVSLPSRICDDMSFPLEPTFLTLFFFPFHCSVHLGRAEQESDTRMGQSVP